MQAGWATQENTAATREDCDAGVLRNCEYSGETGENCEAGVGLNCEPVETAEPAVLG